MIVNNRETFLHIDSDFAFPPECMILTQYMLLSRLKFPVEMNFTIGFERHCYSNKGPFYLWVFAYYVSYK